MCRVTWKYNSRRLEHPEPLTTNNCWPSRAEKVNTHVRGDRVRKMQQSSAQFHCWDPLVLQLERPALCRGTESEANQSPRRTTQPCHVFVHRPGLAVDPSVGKGGRGGGGKGGPLDAHHPPVDPRRPSDPAPSVASNVAKRLRSEFVIGGTSTNCSTICMAARTAREGRAGHEILGTSIACLRTSHQLVRRLSTEDLRGRRTAPQCAAGSTPAPRLFVVQLRRAPAGKANLINMTPLPIIPKVHRRVSKKPCARRGNTSHPTKNKATISPNIGRLWKQRGGLNSSKLKRGNPFSKKTTRVATKCRFNKVTSTVSSTSSPRGGSIDTRQLRKSTMPKQTPRPMSLIHSHEIMKPRIFTRVSTRGGKVHSQNK